VAALKLLEQALEWNATHFILWLDLGRCQMALGLIGPAQRSFSQAQQLNPLSVQAADGLEHLSAGGNLEARITGAWRRLFQR